MTDSQLIEQRFDLLNLGAVPGRVHAPIAMDVRRGAMDLSGPNHLAPTMLGAAIIAQQPRDENIDDLTLDRAASLAPFRGRCEKIREMLGEVVGRYRRIAAELEQLGLIKDLAGQYRVSMKAKEVAGEYRPSVAIFEWNGGE